MKNQEIGQKLDNKGYGRQHAHRKKTALAWSYDMWMDHQPIPQALYWEVTVFRRGPGRPRTNWRGTVK